MFAKVEMALKRLRKIPLADGATFSARRAPTSTEAGSLLRWVGSSFNALIRRESAENRDAGVSETYQHVQLTEVPLYADADYTLAGLFPAIPNVHDTTIVGEFTARGEGDYTHRTWVRAARGEGNFRAVFLAWYWHEEYQRPRRESDLPLSPAEEDFMSEIKRLGHAYPLRNDGHLIPELRAVWDRGEPLLMHHFATGFKLCEEQMLWRRDMIESFAGDIDKWKREFPSTPAEAFSSAGRRLIPSTVMDLMSGYMRDPLDKDRGKGEYISTIGTGGKGMARWMPARDGRFHRWELPKAGASYVITCDPSSGVGVDPTGIQVLKVEYKKITVVAEFNGMERPHEIARLLARVGRHYRDGATFSRVSKKLEGGRPAQLAIESNGFGDHVIIELTQNLAYKRVWRSTDRRKDNWKAGHAYGFATTRTTKMPMLHHLQQLCYDKQVVCPAVRTLESLRAVRYLDDEDKTAGAAKGEHDDLAMSLGIGVLAASQMSVFRHKLRVDDRPEWLQGRQVVFDRTGH
jgi:hypothetical protein